MNWIDPDYLRIYLSDNKSLPFTVTAILQNFLRCCFLRGLQDVTTSENQIISKATKLSSDDTGFRSVHLRLMYGLLV